MKFIALDFETANSGRDSVCEIGLTFVKDGKITGSYSRLVKPLDNWFDPFNTSLHVISANTVKNEPEFHQIWEEIEPHLEGQNLIAHNAGFDMSVAGPSFLSLRQHLPASGYFSQSSPRRSRFNSLCRTHTSGVSAK